ncbi:MAG: hypothetical protein HKN87_05720 [Saprospiraceae bacterium]|nr:hypothetical protein [Saprospiraceae bacterium]
MWTCPECNRNFATTNQSHICTSVTLDDLFMGRSEELILAFDKLLVSVIDWEPCSVGTSTKSVVFTKRKAWLIVKPMSKELDVKFYHPEVIQSPLIKKITSYPNKHAHHCRVSDESQVTIELINLLRKGWEAYD